MYLLKGGRRKTRNHPTGSRVALANYLRYFTIGTRYSCNDSERLAPKYRKMVGMDYFTIVPRTL